LAGAWVPALEEEWVDSSGEVSEHLLAEASAEASEEALVGALVRAWEDE